MYDHFPESYIALTDAYIHVVMRLSIMALISLSNMRELSPVLAVIVKAMLSRVEDEWIEAELGADLLDMRFIKRSVSPREKK